MVTKTSMINKSHADSFLTDENAPDAVQDGRSICPCCGVNSPVTEFIDRVEFVVDGKVCIEFRHNACSGKFAVFLPPDNDTTELVLVYETPQPAASEVR